MTAKNAAAAASASLAAPVEDARVRAVRLFDRLGSSPGIAAVAAALRELQPIRSAITTVKLRIAAAATFTFDPLRAAVDLQALRAGIDAELFIAPYGQVAQQLLDPASPLAAFKPDVVFVAARLADLAPAVYDSFNSLTSAQAEALVDGAVAALRDAMAAFRGRSKAALLIQNWEQPARPALGIADGAAETSHRGLIERANRALRQVAAAIPNAFVMDYDGLVARAGRDAWADARTALFARIPVAPGHYWALAGFYVSHVRPLAGLSKKVLCLDADNTLWGGVVGDVGADGIALGPDYPGNAFVAFQKRVLDLHRRGVVLALCSKNEPAAVHDVLDRHGDMVLRREHFAAMRINWDAKPANLQSIAAELNLGLDSFVFLDDSPVECEMVRSALPQVLCVTMPAEPAAYAAVVDALNCFDQWTLSEEDRRRGEMYAAESRRRQLQTVTVDLPTFYRQLDMAVSIGIDQPLHAARAAQLAARTNQFNMHTVRCTEDDIRRWMADPGYQVVTLALADRFGDNGIVGLAVVRTATGQWTLHMFLMSCRILGRTVEQAFVRWLAARARAAGAAALVAEFVPTAKNKPFAGFYGDCGFSAESAAGEVAGPQRWTLALEAADTTIPDWIRIVESAEPPADAGRANSTESGP